MNNRYASSRLDGALGKAIIVSCNAAFATIEAARRLMGRRPVESISTTSVQKAIARNSANIVLVDVRDDAEHQVSRIPGAITRREYEADPKSHRDKTIVPYCTVGGRSYLYTRRLVAQGVDAKNYRDSILSWVRSGLPLETADGDPTTAIHPYWRLFRVPDDYEVQT